jgi:hypothetical protein
MIGNGHHCASASSALPQANAVSMRGAWRLDLHQSRTRETGRNISKDVKYSCHISIAARFTAFVEDLR